MRRAEPNSHNLIITLNGVHTIGVVNYIVGEHLSIPHVVVLFEPSNRSCHQSHFPLLIIMMIMNAVIWGL